MNHDDHAAETHPLPPSKPGMDRRTLLRAGVAATPIIATLYSRPVAASNCTVASAFVSLVTFISRNPNITSMRCSNLSATHWHSVARAQASVTRNQRAEWASLRVSTYLGRAPAPLPGLDSMTPDAYEVWQVMGYGDSVSQAGELGVLQHILALALSIDYGGSAVSTGSGMHTPYLREVWANYKSNGRYILSSSQLNWSEGELITWLRMLQYPIAVSV